MPNRPVAVSRHPNYFFGRLVWVSFAIVAIPSPLGLLGFISPAVMLVLLLRVSGIPPAEAQALRTRGEGDAVATQTYARAYAKNPEFYAFWRSMRAYEQAIGREGDLLVITPDGEFFKYLKDAGSPSASAPRH